MNQSIIHVALVVRDYDEAIEFYCQKLHFTLVEDSYQPGSLGSGGRIHHDYRTSMLVLPEV